MPHTNSTHLPQAQSANAEIVCRHQNKFAIHIMGTYVSGDELERAEAREMGYEVVCQHPNEVGILGADEKLVLDFDHVMFGDNHEAIFVALKAARNGVRVGIHTFHPHHPLLEPLKKLPGVTIGKTHRELRATVGSKD